MPISCEEQIVRVRAAGDPRELWTISCDFLRENGARMIAYRHFIGQPDPNEKFMAVSEGFPEDFVAELFRKGLIALNPIPELAARTADLFFWSDVPSMTALLDTEEEFITQRVLPVIGDGLAIQVFGPMARNGLFNVGFGPEKPVLSYRKIKEFQLACQLSHLAFIRMTPDYVHGGVPMTAREREVLEWIARGKSNSVIADILGISVHTVDTHVRRIFRKLDVNDRTTAAVKGLGAGLVQSAA